MKTKLALVVLLILLPLGFTAWYAFPIWDDGWLILLLKEKGLNYIYPAMVDRPLAGMLFWLMASLKLVTPTAAGILVFISWSIYGLESAMLWNRLFPGLSHYTTLIVVIVISPVLTIAQLPIFNILTAALLPVMLGYAGVLLALEYLSKTSTYLLILSLMSFALGTLISEYAVPCAIVAAALTYKRGRLRTPALILGVTFLTYIAFIAWAHLGVIRADTSPLYIQTSFTAKFWNFPISLIGSIWQITVGAWGSALGKVAELSRHDKGRLLAAMYGVIVGSTLVYSCRGKVPIVSPRTILRYIAIFFAGLLPVLIMGRIPYIDYGTRFMIPVLPIAAIIIVLFLVMLAHQKFVFVPIFLVGVAAGSSTALAVKTAIETERGMAQIAEVVRPEISDAGLTVVVVPYPEKDYELTGKSTSKWTTEESQHAWFVNRDQAEVLFGPRGKCGDQTINRAPRFVERSGAVGTILWAENGSILEPYCVR